MECIINFLTDEYQKNLVNMIQNRNETFETALDVYKKIFILRKEQCYSAGDLEKNSSEKKGYCNICKEDSCMYWDSCKKISEEISKIDVEKFIYFFEGIRECYSNWVNSMTAEALAKFECLLRDYGLLPQCKSQEGIIKNELVVSDIQKRIYYRGRVTKEYLGKWEMFHVPYNKRYIIKNGRFSLTGQPLLYLANSIVDVMEELGVDRNDKEQIKYFKVSSYEFLEDKAIYDLRCNIWQDLKYVEKPTFNDRKMFRNILAIICSFPKKKGLTDSAFTEEYVIPQMLAHILKREGYDGICHYSTVPFYNMSYSINTYKNENIIRNMAYKENLVIFTNPNIREDKGFEAYDEGLYNTLEVSMPIGIENVRECSEKTLDKLWQEIIRHYERMKTNFITEKNKIKCTDDCNECTQDTCDAIRTLRQLNVMEYDKDKAEKIYDFYQKTFKVLLDGQQNYSNTYAGKIQLQLLIGLFNRLLVRGDSIGHEKENVCPKESVEEERNILTCDLLGNPREYVEESKVHTQGMLHKSYLLILYNGSKEDTCRIALYNNKYRLSPVCEGHYGENEEIITKKSLPEIENIIQEKEEWDLLNTAVFRGTVIDDGLNSDKIFLKDFEVIEIYGVKAEEKQDEGKEEQKGLEWYELKEILKKYENNSNLFDAKLERVFPFIIRGILEKINNYDEGSKLFR